MSLASVRSPATSFVAAMDEPWRFLRRDFGRWAPASFGIAAVGALPALFTQWFAAGMSMKPGDVDFLAIGGMYTGLCGILVATVISQLGAFVIAARALDGEQAGFGEAVLGALSPRMLLLGGTALGTVVMGFGCILGGPPMLGLLGFVPVVVLGRPGEWFGAAGEAIGATTRRASPVDAGAPIWKLMALGCVWYGISMVTTQLATLPTAVWTIWHLVATLGAGDIAAALQSQAPFPVGASAALLGAALRPFAEMYLAAGATILWRDLARVRHGADLEALVEGRAAAG